MNRQDFVEAFAIHFMATRIGMRYDEACMTGEHWRLVNGLAVFEDALYLGEKAWEHRQAMAEPSCGFYGLAEYAEGGDA